MPTDAPVIPDTVPFYLATGFPQADFAHELIGVLELHGYRQTYHWPLHRPSNPERPLTPPGEIANLELQGVRDADFVVVLLPGGKGTHGELYAAITLGKPVLLLGRDLDLYPNGDRRYEVDPTVHPSECVCPLYHHHLVYRIELQRNRTAPELVGDVIQAIGVFQGLVEQTTYPEHPAARRPKVTGVAL